MNKTLAMVIKPINTRMPYTSPSWAKNILKNESQHGRLHLANLPTPIHRIAFAPKSRIFNEFIPQYCNLYIKHDDATGGAELGGNKIRKLEFLLADALAQNAKCVVTIGGEQSNHCRATAAACRKVGLEPHLVLRSRRKNQFEKKKQSSVNNGKHDETNKEFGFVGNILFDRMVGSHIYLVSPGEYGRFGSVELVKRVCDVISRNAEKDTENLRDRIKDNEVYAIPVGGSNGIGTWGYIEAVDELMKQWYHNEDKSTKDEENIDHIVFATGSGGTATGIVLGVALAHESKGISIPKMHAVGVCDDPDYFYETMASIAEEMGFDHSSGITAIDFIKKYVTVYQGKGSGYAVSTEDEIKFVSSFAIETGITLDPVYTGKAMYHFMSQVMPNDEFRHSNVLFWHTGGALGMYEKGKSLSLNDMSPVTPLELYGETSDGS